MQAPKRILVAVDFSSCSRAALKRASELAGSFGAVIDLLHVWSVPTFLAPDSLVGYPGANKTFADLVQKDANDGMAEFAKQVRADGIPFERTILICGEPARTIVEEAQHGKYDLIAIGTHGRTGFSHLLLGSVAEKVVRLADRPVLTVREPKA
jgi:nucleotide-binding universal stress UspA family protein